MQLALVTRVIGAVAFLSRLPQTCAAPTFLDVARDDAALSQAVGSTQQASFARIHKIAGSEERRAVQWLSIIDTRMEFDGSMDAGAPDLEEYAQY